nr:short ORF [Barley stripe mosaic virus]
MTLKRS